MNPIPAQPISDLPVGFMVVHEERYEAYRLTTKGTVGIRLRSLLFVLQSTIPLTPSSSIGATDLLSQHVTALSVSCLGFTFDLKLELPIAKVTQLILKFLFIFNH
jgi:hypothetical protein